MLHTNPPLEDRFVGCLLGLAVGDALGAHFEGREPEFLALCYRKVSDLFESPPPGELWYTDDTQMAIGVAETLVAAGQIDEDELCRRFAANYVPQRGYGRGTRRVLEAMTAGGDHKTLAASTFPGGSLGNGAAMRVAPVGLMFRHDHETLWEQAKRSAMPTHTHPLGIEGAQALALAVGLASTVDEINRDEFLLSIAARCTSLEFSGPLRRAAHKLEPRDLCLFGNGIEATASVVTAIASFALTPYSYQETIGNAILLGGDTDTMAAMAGAISGAFLGKDAIPKNEINNLEDNYQGKSCIEQLARNLFARYEVTRSKSTQQLALSPEHQPEA
jgi:poly(ADP-ribose) glycohydrolase ARH3